MGVCCVFLKTVIQVHQSIIVNINVIAKYDFNESILELKSGLKVPVGRSYKKSVAEVLEEL